MYKENPKACKEAIEALVIDSGLPTGELQFHQGVRNYRPVAGAHLVTKYEISMEGQNVGDTYLGNGLDYFDEFSVEGVKHAVTGGDWEK